MTRFPEDYQPNNLLPPLIETIKAKLSLDQVVREYALLFDLEGELIGKCPFMGCNGSIAVDRNNAFFECNSCERNGDVLSFIMEIEHLTLNETIKVILSRYAGL